MNRSGLVLAITLMTIVLTWYSCSQSNSSVSVATNYSEIPADKAKELQKVLKAKNIEQLPNENLDIIKEYLAKKLLENPAPWGIDIRGNYFWNIYNALPSFVSAKDRHTGYNMGAREYTNNEQLMAYAIWRIDRSSDNILRLFKFAKPLIKSIVPDNNYSSWGIETYVNEAIHSYSEIANIPNYNMLLHNAYAQADTTTGAFMWEGKSRYFRSFENSAYGFTADELNQIISSHLGFDRHNNLSTSPWLSFWMRRNHEGNIQVVYDILNQIREMYSPNQSHKMGMQTEDANTLNLHYNGKLIHTAKWTDSNGENIVILSEDRTEDIPDDGLPSLAVELFAYHYANSGNGFNLINMISDSEMGCDFENRARFMEESLTVTDVNGDGYSEAVFAYRLGCSSEISPDRLVLIAMENGTNYTINGTTRVFFDDSMPALGGETHVGKEFTTAPKKLLAHAKSVWRVQQESHNNFYKPRLYQLAELKRFHGLTLLGVEPFWDITLSDTNLVLSQPSEESLWFEYNRINISNDGVEIEASGSEPHETIYITFSEGSCSDGMSDNTHPYRASLVYKGNTFEGCGRWKE